LSSSAQADDLVIAEIDDWHGGASFDVGSRTGRKITKGGGEQ
jgi:hypothetical protein